MKTSAGADDVNFVRELEKGKMLGVLFGTDSAGVSHTLYAFSGQVGGRFSYEGFVGAPFDYLSPGGYFLTEQAAVERKSSEIRSYEERLVAPLRERLDKVEAEAETRISAFKEKCRQAKKQRQAERASGLSDALRLAELERRSQFEKAELRRMKAREETISAPLRRELAEALSILEGMKEARKAASESLQEWLFSSFRVLNACGESRSLREIFALTALKVPPSGAGECCAPKLLQAAYQQGLTPVAMAEYWYGHPGGDGLRIHGEHYPACRGKCGPILNWMLRGLTVQPPLDAESTAPAPHVPEIIFENEWFCVINKPAGMLSVPGKGAAISAEEWLARRYGSEKHVRMVHRLDQDTSGVLVAALSLPVLKTLQKMFATREVKKTYVADLEGDYTAVGLPAVGTIRLPLSPDWFDRPRQMVDPDGGKEAVTRYEFKSVREGLSRVTFHPLTGRTHQLRVHSAASAGLGMPIVGDRLYGRKNTATCGRLHLHAHKIEFTFPIDGQHYCFESAVPF